MKKLLSGFACAVLFLMAAVSCRAAEEINVTNGIRFTISAAQDTFKAGSPIPIALEFENVSNEKINFFFNKCPVEFLKLFVYDANGKEIYAQRAMHIAPCRPATSLLLNLRPGQIKKDAIDIGKIIEDLVVENGRYQLVFTYRVPNNWKDIGTIDDKYWKWKVQSNIIVITVVKTFLVENVKDAGMKSRAEAQIRELFNDRSINVTKIEKITNIDVFKDHLLLRVYVTPEALLKHKRGPSGESYGLFAYADGRFTYLSGNNDNFLKILREEKRDIVNDIYPADLARALLLSRADDAYLVGSTKDVFNFERMTGPMQGYKVHRRSLNKFKKTLTRPKWVDNIISNDLEFFALVGETGALNRLTRIVARFDKETPELSIDTETLESDIFKETPAGIR